jgi:cephalosporin hydroxylase
MTDWQNFYNNIKDKTWPECASIADFVKLSDQIKIEILQDHLFSSKEKNLQDCLRHLDPTIPNSLNYHEKIRSVIGHKHCLMSSQDAIFLYSIIWSKRPNAVLEIGRYHGWSSAIIFGALEDSNHGQLYSVDIEKKINPVIENLISSRTTLITCDSKHLQKNDFLSQIKFRVIFIDGDHRYQAVKNDLDVAYQLSDAESWILCHDIDIQDTGNAVNDWAITKQNITNCGVYGEKIGLLYKHDHT